MRQIKSRAKEFFDGQGAPPRARLRQAIVQAQQRTQEELNKVNDLVTKAQAVSLEVRELLDTLSELGLFTKYQGSLQTLVQQRRNRLQTRIAALQDLILRVDAGDPVGPLARDFALLLD